MVFIMLIYSGNNEYIETDMRCFDTLTVTWCLRHVYTSHKTNTSNHMEPGMRLQTGSHSQTHTHAHTQKYTQTFICVLCCLIVLYSTQS